MLEDNLYRVYDFRTLSSAQCKKEQLYYLTIIVPKY